MLNWKKIYIYIHTHTYKGNNIPHWKLQPRVLVYVKHMEDWNKFKAIYSVDNISYIYRINHSTGSLVLENLKQLSNWVVVPHLIVTHFTFSFIASTFCMEIDFFYVAIPIFFMLLFSSLHISVTPRSINRRLCAYLILFGF